MKRFLSNIARIRWPNYDGLVEADQIALLRELFGTLMALPFVALALFWLLAATDTDLLREQWRLLLLMLLLSILAARISFFQTTVDRDGYSSYNGSSLEIVVVMSALLLFGPTAVWIPFLARLIDSLMGRWRVVSRYRYWNRVRNLTFNVGPNIVSLLLMLTLYQGLGGQFPLTGLTAASTGPAFVSIALWLPLDGLFILLYGILLIFFQLATSSQNEDRTGFGRRLLKFFFVASLPAFFGILGAATYSQLGLFAFLFFVSGVLLVSLLAHRLSQQALVSQQRSREVSQLEQLGRAILASPVDASTLPQLLADHVSQMFAYRQLEIRLHSGETLLCLPDDLPPFEHEIWDWSWENPKDLKLSAGDTPPWTKEKSDHPLYLQPILSPETRESTGGICLILNRPYFLETMIDLGPALQVLAAQIGTALQQAQVHIQTLAHQKTLQELEFAWKIQESFLPSTLPQIEGWQLAAVLNPCKETSGDFYDVISLPNGSLGLLIADVTDKGLGAALFMALSRTLIRTYAFEHPTRPDLVLQSTNQRILSDTRNTMFVTVFYAVLDLSTGRLTYANAGHNPPYLFRSGRDDALDIVKARGLRNTGMPLGILEDAGWQAKTVDLDLGDTLILYTDGVTEAQNLQDDFFGDEGLLTVAKENLNSTAAAIQKALLSAVEQFSGAGVQCDDETLIVIRRTDPS